MALGETIAFEVLTLSICSFVMIAHRGTKKVTTTYWGGLGVSIAYLVFLIAGAGGKHGSYFFTHIDEIIPATEYGSSSIASYVLTTNLCYLFAFAMPILLIVDPTRRAARALAPICSLSSMMVLIVVIPFGYGGDPHFTLEYILLGNYDSMGINPEQTVAGYQVGTMYYSLHLINLLFALGVGMTTPRHGGKGLIAVGGAYGLSYLYIGSILLFTHQVTQCAGLVPGDFTNGNFKMVYNMCGNNLPLAVGVFFATVISIMFIGTLLQDFIFKHGWYRFGNAKSGVWGKYGDYEHYVDNANQKDGGKLAKYMKEVR